MATQTRLGATGKRLAPLNDAAAYAGVHPRTLRRRIAEGALAGYRMGPRLIRVDLNELDELLRPIPSAGVPPGLPASPASGRTTEAAVREAGLLGTAPPGGTSTAIPGGFTSAGSRPAGRSSAR